MEQVCCQSCSMPMQEHVEFGLEIDGRLNKEYCGHCYQLGQFTAFMNMEQMIHLCSQYWKVTGHANKEEAIRHMRQVFPKLKRWQKAA